MPYSGQAKSDSHPKPTGVNADTSLESVRTLASTKYFDDWSGKGAWSIVIANRAIGDLRRMRKGDGHVFKMVSKKIKELSQGFFSDDNQKRLVGLNTEVPIYEAKVSRDLRIVYQIDLDTDVEAKIDKQIIKLYGIYTHAQMDKRLWSLVSYYHATRRGKEYRRRCSFRDTPRTLGHNVTLPAQFPHEEDIEFPIEPQADGAADTNLNMKAEDISAVRSLVASEKFILMSKSLVKSIVDDLDGGHIFQVSSREKEVIYYDSACFVLGRSGTGKTTCIVFKMLGIEKMYDWAEEERPRQVFITQSPELAQRVQEYYQTLVDTDSNQAARSSEMIADDESILADLRDEDVEAFGLPSRYSLLEDKHFPLFVTFDQLCSLLEEDYKSEFGCMARSQGSARRFHPTFTLEIENESKDDWPYINEKLLPAVLTMDKIKENKHAFITFEVFAIAYWPHFDQRLTKDLDPALVFSEFLGVIEGSEFTLASQSGVLSRSEYMELSDGGSLLSSQRDKIYALYESYRKARGQRSGYDAAERTHALIIATQDGKRLPGPKIDAIYVDEAQDNLLIDTKLIRNLSNNPHGILMAGDTAQTISAGSSFRFEDLKAFSWRLETQDEAVKAKKRKPIHPTLFHLSVNYRSHGGIVDCASAIVELVSELFPNSIDKLKKETGLIGGPLPTFFSGWEHSSIPIGQFLRDKNDVKVDFGAHQVILVRNDAARDALRAQLGEIGLVLTLYERLEFNDVLLYNFFEDSVASDTTWRVVLHGLNSRQCHPLPQFEEVRHAVICSELKNLYVGLTRARNHCWILDVSERAEPMKTFWTKRNLVEKCGPGDRIPQLSASSSKLEWEERGRALFERQLYSQAVLCFEKAGLSLERDISAAYEARKKARLSQATKPNDRETRSTFRYAANKFLECSKIAASKQQKSCCLRAADCFVQAEEWKLASETFILVPDFGMAAKCLRNAGCFTEAVDLIKTHQEDIPENIAEEIKKVARLEYLRTDQFDQAEELFNDLDEQLDYMEDCGLENGRIHVLEQHHRHEEAKEAAATAAFKEGNIIEGIRLLKASNDPKLLCQAIEKALEGLWLFCPLGRKVDNADTPAADTLIQFLNNERGILTEEEEYQLEVFHAIREGDLCRILSLAQSHGILASGSPSRSILSLLCFSWSSSSLIPSKEWSIQHFINTSKSTWKYISQLFLFARTLDISQSSTQRLLGAQLVESSTSSVESNEDVIVSSGFRIYSTSLLFNYLEQLERTSQEVPAYNPVLNLSFSTANESETREIALNVLYDMLRSEISKVHNAAFFDFQAMYPCLDFAVFGNCKRVDCHKQHTNSLRASESERQVSFNLRTRALIMQIYIVDKYYTSTHPNVSERRKIRRTCAHKMYESLMPLFPPLGGPHCVDGAFIPELDNGAHLISVWCHQALFELDPRYGAEDRFLSDALTFLDLAFRVDGGRFATYVGALHSSRLVKVRRDLMTNKPRSLYDRSVHSIMHDFINFYRRKSDDVIRRVIQATHYVAMNELTIEVNLLVHLLEFIGREIIVQHRTWNRGKYGVFDGLVVPQSWALDIAKRPPLIVQTGFGLSELMEYLSTLYKTLENLRRYSPNTSCLYSFSGKGALNLLGRGILISRVCRLIVLVANNTNFTGVMKEDARLSITRALTGPEDVHRLLCERLIHTSFWSDLERTIMCGALNRGTDRLVHLFLRKGYNYPQPHSSNFIQVIPYNHVPELNRLLSFKDSVQRPQPMLNPQAQPYNPSHLGHPSPANQAITPSLQNELEPAEGDDTDLMRSGQESTHFSTAPESRLNSRRRLTIKEVGMGRIILLAYRKYVLRKQTRQRLAAEKICRCYSRYLRRRNAPRSAADDRYFKFQREYMNDIKTLKAFRPIMRSFYLHKAILLGCMPHVAVYLRGLEHANQKQKHANRKRLQIAHHKELEDIQARMDACSEFTTTLKKLASAVMPGSNELQDLHVLRKHVKELETLYHKMGEVFGRDLMPTFLEYHRQCGVAVILAQPA